MIRTAIKSVLARKRRLFTTTLAISLGVAFMAGTLVLTDTIGRTFDTLFADVYRDTDAVVRARAVFEGPENTGDQRGRVDASLVEAVRNVEGVKVAEGGILGFARLLAKDGEALGDPEFGAPTLGGDWSRTDELNPFRLVAGRPPIADDDVVIDRRSAEEGDLAVGDATTVLVQAGPQPVRITGIATFGTADNLGGASIVLFNAPVAQRLIAEPDKFDTINVLDNPLLTEPLRPDHVKPRLLGHTGTTPGSTSSTPTSTRSSTPTTSTSSTSPGPAMAGRPSWPTRGSRAPTASCTPPSP